MKTGLSAPPTMVDSEIEGIDISPRWRFVTYWLNNKIRYDILERYGIFRYARFFKICKLEDLQDLIHLYATW